MEYDSEEIQKWKNAIYGQSWTQDAKVDEWVSNEQSANVSSSRSYKKPKVRSNRFHGNVVHTNNNNNNNNSSMSSGLGLGSGSSHHSHNSHSINNDDSSVNASYSNEEWLGGSSSPTINYRSAKSKAMSPIAQRLRMHREKAKKDGGVPFAFAR